MPQNLRTGSPRGGAVEPQDLYIRIGGGSSQDSGRTRVVFRLPFDDIERVAEIETPPLLDREPATLAATTSAFATALAQVVTQGSQPAAQPLSIPAGMSSLSILLDISQPEFYGLDWENVFRPPLFPPSEVTRYRPQADERVLTPFDLPAGLLVAAGPSEPPGLAPTDASLRYFRSVRALDVSRRDVRRLVSTGSFEIVHLRISGDWADRQMGVLRVGQHGETLSHRVLLRCLKTGRTRLLVLESTAFGSFEPLADLSHRLLARGGPSIILLETLTPALFFDSFYLDIVHDVPLDAALRRLRPFVSRAALFLSMGGADVLRISPLATRLAIDAGARALETLDVASLLREHLALASAPARIVAIHGSLREAETSASRLETAATTAYNYQHEHGAWEPIGRAQREAYTSAQFLSDLRRRTDRVVNTWFSRDTGPLERSEALRPGEPCRLVVQIGRHSEHSVVQGPMPIPERELERFYTDDGISLRVVLFSSDFQLERTDAQLRLPRPPRESAELEFPLRAPPALGTARLRVCVYYEQNLLQSILVRAHIRAEQPRRHRRTARAIVAEVEFALSGTLRDFERLSARHVNFLMNEGDGGTHTFEVVGKDLREHFDFSEGAVRGLVNDVRRELQDVCADVRNNEPKYRFDDENRGSEKQFCEDLRRLAELGYELYVKLVTGQDSSFQEGLGTALGTSGARIQIAAVKSAQYVFPWALVYDHPILAGVARPCPQFLEDLRRGGQVDFLVRQRCLTIGCPSAGDPAIVCPSGFWGFKHIVEQPLSVHAPDRKDTRSKTSDTPRELVASIDVPRPAPFLMAVSRNLRQVDDHERQVKGDHDLRDLAVSLRDTKLGVGAGLQSPGVGIVYFYCHGGRSGSRTWLGIGKNEQLVAADLFAWKVQWPILHPLIFINGCHTVDITPDDLLRFNDMLRWCRAAGVIGTEISIPEVLARDFGLGFLRRFVAGRNVGQAMHEQRLSLLARYNVVGLAYTPYCWGDLALKFV